MFEHIWNYLTDSDTSKIIAKIGNMLLIDEYSSDYILTFTAWFL